MAVKSRMLNTRANVLAYLMALQKSGTGDATESGHRDGRKDPYPFRVLLGDTLAVHQDFFARPAPDLARDLLGCVLIHGETAGMIVETEAYLGLDDLAAHASHGLTERTKVLFGPAGRAYVYFTYGMHECLNVVADREGVPGCVLIRALEPLCGIAAMYDRRQWRGTLSGLANGPAKLTQALAISRTHYGERLDRGAVRIRRWRKMPSFEVQLTPRIGISTCVDWPLRFIWAGHACLSK